MATLLSMAPIAVGDVIPEGTLSYLDQDSKPHTVSIHSLAAGKKVIIFGVPGAFTPTCSLKHVPGFIERAQELKGRGVDELICISVDDPRVMNAWAKTYPENKHVKFLADGSAKYTQALGLELDLTEKGFGIRSRRFALLVEDLKLKVANVKSGGEFTISSADEIITRLFEPLHPPTLLSSAPLFWVISSAPLLSLMCEFFDYSTCWKHFGLNMCNVCSVL